jgi:hypothetical protein
LFRFSINLLGLPKSGQAASHREFEQSFVPLAQNVCAYAAAASVPDGGVGETGRSDDGGRADIGSWAGPAVARISVFRIPSRYSHFCKFSFDWCDGGFGRLTGNLIGVNIKFHSKI